MSLNIRLPQASNTRVMLRMFATFTFSAVVRAKTRRLVLKKAISLFLTGALKQGTALEIRSVCVFVGRLD